MRVWITKREQRRRYADGLLSDLLSDPEQRVYLPLVAPGPQETLEEIEIRGRQSFVEAGGHEFTYIPCLNESPAWIDVLERMVRDWNAGKLAA